MFKSGVGFAGTNQESLFLEPGSITIVKDAAPSDGTDFTFTSNISPTFTLDDAFPDDIDGLSDSITFAGLPSGSYIFTETLPAGNWNLKDIECIGGGSIVADVPNLNVTINLGVDEDVLCTFVNELPRAYLPIIKSPSAYGIHGFVTDDGAPASGVSINLRFYNGVSWSTRGTTTTDQDGMYKFLEMPDLQNGQYYYVRFLNQTNPTRLFTWHTAGLEQYNGGTIHIGDFDIKNIELVSPASGAVVSVPRTFRWTKRTASPTDDYEFNLFDEVDGDPWFWTDPPLGYVNSYTLDSLPQGFVKNYYYLWHMWVYDGLGGYGTAYWAYWVAFTNTGLTPLQVPSAQTPRWGTVEQDLTPPYQFPPPPVLDD